MPLYAAHVQGPESDNEAEEEYAVSPKMIRYILFVAFGIMLHSHVYKYQVQLYIRLYTQTQIII